jgi:hypothetical protein
VKRGQPFNIARLMTLRSLSTRRLPRKEANFTERGAALVSLRRFPYADFVAYQQYQLEMADLFLPPPFSRFFPNATGACFVLLVSRHDNRDMICTLPPSRLALARQIE